MVMTLVSIMLVVMLAGASQKNNNPPPAPKPAPATKPAPAPNQAQTAPAVKPAPARAPAGTPGPTATQGSQQLKTLSGQPPRTFGSQPPKAFSSQPPKTFSSQPPKTFSGPPTKTSGGPPTKTSGGPPTKNFGGPPTRNSGGGGTGGKFGPTRRPIETVRNKDGTSVQVSRRPNGRPADISTTGPNAMKIHRDTRGGRTIVAERNGRTIVSTGRGGYVQSPYRTVNGKSYYQRTYVSGGRSYARVYRGYDYHGVRYYSYVPARYYRPAFYAWAYNPWPRFYYSPGAWGWVGAPWFGLYAGFFAPYPVYTGASLWLTDYLIAANLQAAYQAQVEANADAAAQANAQNQPPPDYSGASSAAPTQTPLSPEVKQAIAVEVQQQLAAEKDAAANPPAPLPAPTGGEVPDALNPAERVFVVASNLDVTMAANGQECTLTAGDVVTRLTDSPDANQNVNASIQSSKKGDCATGQTVAVGVQDLQEMHNQFRAQLDSGLQQLAANGGKGNLPKAPDTATTAGEVPAPAPDSGAAAQITTQQQQADKTEVQLVN